MSIKTDNTQTLVNALAEIERLRDELEGYRALKRLHSLETYPNEITARAWLLRQKAEAVEKTQRLISQAEDITGMRRAAREYSESLRQQAAELENNNEQNN